MPTKHLTKKGLDSLKALGGKDTAYWDTLLKSFGVRVSARTGRKTFFVRYVSPLDGKHRRYRIGQYDPEEFTLADARQKARGVLSRVSQGEDPAQPREAVRKRKTVFRDMAVEAIEARTRANEKTTRERIQLLDRELAPWHHRDPRSIKRPEIRKLLSAIVKEGKGVTANRTLRLIQLLWNQWLRDDVPGIEGNPGAEMDLPYDEQPRDRCLSRDEIKALWPAIEAERHPLTVGAFKLALLTAQRIGSVRAMRWQDINRDAADAWTIPAESFKGKRKHLVPLSAEALETLEAVKDSGLSGDVWVFPSRAGSKLPHIHSTTTALKRVRERVGGEPFTVHDFRTTFRTHATRAVKPDYPKDPAGCGVSPDVADEVLGHKILSVGQTHYQADKLLFKLAEKREALARWGEWVRGIVGTG